MLEQMREHAQRLRQLVLRLIHRDSRWWWGAKRGFGTAGWRWRFFVQGHEWSKGKRPWGEWWGWRRWQQYLKAAATCGALPPQPQPLLLLLLQRQLHRLAGFVS